MNNHDNCFNEYRLQMQKGEVPRAYKAIIEFMMQLKTRLSTKYPDFSLSSNIYQGYMDMTYFSIVPPELKALKLKIAVVFLHDKFRFEVWLAAVNRQIRDEYRQAFESKNLELYRLSNNNTNPDSIIEFEICIEPDFTKPENLAETIDKAAMTFSKDIIVALKSI